jgi:hypothetical protein
LAVTPCLPADWPRAEADVLYKGRRYHVTIKDGKPQVESAEQVIELPLLWVMDFNLRRTANSVARTTGVEFTGFYGDQITLSAGKLSGSYESPAYGWGQPGKLRAITVAADLHGGEVKATFETSSDGFKTVDRRLEFPLGDGVHDYPLGPSGRPAGAVRVVFRLARADVSHASPVIDAFRVTGMPVGPP